MESMYWFTCRDCNRRSLQTDPNHKCGRTCHKYTANNLMDPGNVPAVLRGLTFVEQQLIARIHPVVCVYRIRGHQMGYRGNVISFPQNVNELALSLPHRIQDLTSIVAVRLRDSDGYVDFRVRCGAVRAALLWLRDNNPYYANIEISEANLALLPENGDVFSQVNGYDDADDPPPPTGSGGNDEDTDESTEEEEGGLSGDVEGSGTNVTMSGVPLLQNHHQEEQVNAVLNWPSTDNLPVDEFNTPG
ncbi:uncharacterized protein LOC113213282, partial [Frankliniella occidentalis]|uniref:Uncharacterized protein LOC113213282 n=1 Tax=Frankliniella occidentalis TaxID=133901 RepID=A0A9C6XA08_FRAOC